ncbi:MAG: dimethylargininase [Janthinobacterium lividum]
MTTTVPTRVQQQPRRVRPRHYLMCPPTCFDVTYAINPWMDPRLPVDHDRAYAQWSGLVAAYRRAGHRVDLLDPVPGLPDMVFAANGATVVDGRTLGARFATPQRAEEAVAHRAWHARSGVLYGGRALVDPVAVNEAEGDFAVLSSVVLAGYGFRTSRDAHAELAALTGREVLSLELVDPRFYHLDVALAVLDSDTDEVAYYPPAFSARSQAVLASRFPDAVVADEADAYAFGLNAVGDGRNVFLPTGAVHLRDAVEARGFVPVEIDTSELLRGGGSVKCCTQEIRPAPSLVPGDPR